MQQIKKMPLAGFTASQEAQYGLLLYELVAVFDRGDLTSGWELSKIQMEKDL